MSKNNIKYVPFQISKTDKFLHLLLFVCISVLPLFPKYTWISTIFLLPGLALLLMLKDKSIKLLQDNFFKRLFILFLFAILSLIWVNSLTAYFEEIKKLLGIIVICIIGVLILRRGMNNIWFLYFILLTKFVIMIYYTYKFGIITNFDAEASRLESGTDVGINANAYGYFAFISLFALGMIMNENKNWIFKVLYIFVLSTSIYINILAASRAGLTFSVVSSIFIYLALTFKTWKVLFIKIGFLAILIGLFILPNISTFENLVIYQRFLFFGETGEDARLSILESGFSILISHPFGIGAGQFPFYMEKTIGLFAAAHNSYLLIAANYGWIALIIYLAMFQYFIKNSFKILKNNNLLIIRYGILFLSFGVLFFMYNFFYDMILNLYIMFMFFLVYSHQSSLINGVKPTMS